MGPRQRPGWRDHFLAQDRHSSYGRDSLGMLKRSVRSLFKYYNARAKDDVLFFHTGLNVSRQSVLPLCAGARARFLELEAHHFSTAPAAAQSDSILRAAAHSKISHSQHDDDRPRTLLQRRCGCDDATQVALCSPARFCCACCAQCARCARCTRCATRRPRQLHAPHT